MFERKSAKVGNNVISANDVNDIPIVSNSTEFDKEFRYSFGYYHVDKDKAGDDINKVLIWHKCTNKAMYMSLSDFKSYEANRKICRNCGVPISGWQQMYHYENARDKKSISLSFKTLNHVKVTVDDFKISIGVFYSRYSMWKDTSLFIKSAYYDRITINIKTGYTYQFSKIELSTKRDADARGGMRRSSIRNISYNGYDYYLPVDVLDYLCPIIDMKMKQRHGENVPGYKLYNVEPSLDVTGRILAPPQYFHTLILYVRNPYLCPALYNDIVHTSRRWLMNSPSLKEVFVKNDCRNPLLQMLSQSKIPDVKSLRKIVFSDARSFPLLASLSRTFQNVDCIRSIYNAYFKYCNHWEHYTTYLDFSATVFKQITKHKGETIAAQKIISFLKRDKDNNAYRTIYDMIIDYDELKHCDFDFSSSYSINELHMYLAAKVARQEIENKEIQYTQDNLSLEASGDNFSLMLPKDTHELIDIGTQMNICVGSYAENAVTGKCVIFILRDTASNTPVGCVELTVGGVHQAKGPNNRLLQNKEREFIVNWIKRNDLDISTFDLIDCN